MNHKFSAGDLAIVRSFDRSLELYNHPKNNRERPITLEELDSQYDMRIGDIVEIEDIETYSNVNRYEFDFKMVYAKFPNSQRTKYMSSLDLDPLFSK